jgi:hypothetical protein
MKSGNYQRRFLRAPLNENVILSDGEAVFRGGMINISEDGLLLSELPFFPKVDELSLLIPIPHFPLFKNLSNEQLGLLDERSFLRRIIRIKAQIVRKAELERDLTNILKSKFGMQFTSASERDREIISQYVKNSSSNLIHLQTLIDSFNSSEDIRSRTRSLSRVMGYRARKIAQLRVDISADYQGLQWL